MGYFDEYLSKNTNKSALKDTTKLQSELKVFDPKKVEVDVTENKYGYKAKDVANVAKLLHEANAHKLSVKTKLSKSPLLYKWEKDASGKKRKVKRGHFEKKKLLKDAEVYEEKVKNQFFPIAENKDTIEYSNILDVSVDEINVEDIPTDVNLDVEETIEQTAEQSIEQTAEQSIEQTTEQVAEIKVEKPKRKFRPIAGEVNKYYSDKSKFTVVDVELPTIRLDIDDKRLILNRDEYEYLSHQKEKLGESDVQALVSLTPEVVKLLRGDNVFLNIIDSIEDDVMIAVINTVRRECFRPGDRLENQSLKKKSSFVDFAELYADLEAIHDGKHLTCDADRLYDLSFRLKLAAGMYANDTGSTLFAPYEAREYAKIMFYLSEKLKKRYYAEKNNGK